MLALFAIIVALLVLLDYVRKRQLGKFAQAIPSINPCLPVLGNSLLFLGKSEQERFRSFEYVFRHTDRISKGWIGPKLIICVAHPDLVQKVLTDPNCCEKPFFYDFINMEHGLFSAKYKLWRPYRKSLNPTFNMKILHSFIPVFEECARVMVEKMKCCPKGVPVDILDFTSECTLEMVCGTTLGTDVLERDGKQEFLKCLKVYFSKVATRVLSVGIYSDVIYRLTKDYCEENRARSYCLDYAHQLIEERRMALEAVTSRDAEDGYERRVPKIFIDQVLSSVDPETKINDQNLSEQILTVIAGGHDTSAQMVAHTCLFLAMFPEYQEKLAAEIESKLPSGGPEIGPESLKDLPFLDKFVKECMRLAPVGPIISRTNLADVQLDGNQIPKGNIFVLNFYILHRRKDIWGPDADQFDPENFAPERAEGRHPFAYLPFGGGSRNCIGARYAMFSNKIMLIHVVRNFRLHTKIKYEDLRYLLDITLNLAFQHLIQLEARK